MKLMLLSIAEVGSWLVIFLVAIKVLVDVPFTIGMTIADPKYPGGFVTWLLDPSPIGFLRDVAVTFLFFLVNRRLVRWRQMESRTHSGQD
jgi:hypothetical protein